MAALLTAAAGLVGLGGYLYVFGGIELYLSFDDASLPAGDAIDVFAARRFLTVGLFVAGVVLLLTVVSLPVALGVAALRRSGRPTEGRLIRRSIRLLVGLFVVWTVVITIGAPLVKPFHLRIARVLTVDHSCIQGPYLSSDGVGTHLVDGRDKRLLLIPAGDVVSVALGSAPEVIKSPIVRLSAAACRLTAQDW